MKEGNWMLSLGLFFLRLAILILVVAAIFRIGQTTYNYCYGVVSDTAVDPEPGRDVSVTITKDMSAGKVAKLLPEDFRDHHLRLRDAAFPLPADGLPEQGPQDQPD